MWLITCDDALDYKTLEEVKDMSVRKRKKAYNKVHSQFWYFHIGST